MAEERVQRRLAAILAADMVGYSRLMEADERGTIARQKAHRAELIDPAIAEHHGRIVKLMGDGMLVEFASVVEAVECAVAIQRAMVEREADVPEEQRIQYRVGVNLGDIVIDGDDILGDGVNVAARLEGLAEPGGICIPRKVMHEVRNKLDVGYQFTGEQKVKNIETPVPVYRVLLESDAAGKVIGERRLRRPLWQLGAVAAAMGAAVAVAAVWWQPWKPTIELASVERMALPLPDRPSIAVLPFTNMSDDPGQGYFADGMTDDLITDLSKISGLFVIASNSTFVYKDRTVEIRQVAEDLGVRYVVEGSVRRSSNTVRVNAQLIDATTGGHVWAERFDGVMSDVFALQDDITHKIVSALAIELSEEKNAQIAMRPTTSIQAYDLYVRGMTARSTYSKAENLRARELFEQAIELDPNFAAAYAALSLHHFRAWALQWTDEAGVLDRALEVALKAVELDDTLPFALVSLSWILVWKDQHEKAIALQERAIALDPGNADAYNRLAATLAFAGRGVEAIAIAKKAMRLNPNGKADYPFHLGLAYYLTGQYEEAIAAYNRALTRSPNFVPAHRFLAIVYSDLGRMEEARAAAAESLRLTPRVTLEIWRSRAPYKPKALLDRLATALGNAGIPEHAPPPVPDKP